MTEIVNNPPPIKPTSFDETIFTWSILRMVSANVGETANVVTDITWCLLGQNQFGQAAHTNTVSYPQEVLLETVALPTFTAFEQLTEQQVLSWVVPNLDEYSLKCSICNRIEEAAALQNTSALPWSQV